MIEERIARLDIPGSDPQARRTAVAAALAAFDEQPSKNFQETPKDSPRPLRLISTIIGRGMDMGRRGRFMAGTAIALVVALPLTAGVVLYDRHLADLEAEQELSMQIRSEPSSAPTAPSSSSRSTGVDMGAVAEGLKTQFDNPLSAIADAIGLGSGSTDRQAQLAPSGPETVQGQREVPPEFKEELSRGDWDRVAQAEHSGSASLPTVSMDKSTGLVLEPLVQQRPQPMPDPDRYEAARRATEEAMRLASGQMSGNMRAPEVPALPEAGAGDAFTRFATSQTKSVAREPVSTFSVDVDTASYSYVRRSIESGVLPPRDAVRVEEMVNYFPYAYGGPDSADVPFLANVSVVDDPWRPGAKLMHVGVKGWEIPASSRPPANIVLLVDTSGSMQEQDKLPLLQASLKMMANALDDRDTVSIVTYAGSSSVALEPTSARDRSRILFAIDSLSAGGGTAGAAGIQTAYDLAERSKVPGGVNRVVLATDGDFNVGISDPEALKDFIAGKRSTGVFLSVLGFGTGNLGDDTMQALAQNGNGTAAYIDGMSEARKVLVDQLGSSVLPIAKDVKIQVEFNPSVVSEYRLVGYETRALAREDFKDDRVDAGDIGSGHAVTAIYEIVPVGSSATRNDPLRYGAPADAAVAQNRKGPASTEYGFVKIRYKLPDGDVSRLVETPVTPLGNDVALERASDDVRFSLAVAAFAGRLRDGAGPSFGDVARMAEGALGSDPGGYRRDFVSLVRDAEALSPR